MGYEVCLILVGFQKVLLTRLRYTIPEGCTAAHLAPLLRPGIRNADRAMGDEEEQVFDFGSKKKKTKDKKEKAHKEHFSRECGARAGSARAWGFLFA